MLTEVSKDAVAILELAVDELEALRKEKPQAFNHGHTSQGDGWQADRATERIADRFARSHNGEAYGHNGLGHMIAR